MNNLAPAPRTHDVVVIGAGAGGIAVAASLFKRCPDLDLAIVDPASEHWYQPGLTMVGAGVFEAESLRRPVADVVPRSATFVTQAVTSVDPSARAVRLADGTSLAYRTLVVAPGIELDWGSIEGLPAALGRGGVTSNYRPDLAPYTWDLVRALKHGTAVFTQPPMPIKCAGAPQKALYLSCDHWRRRGQLGGVDVSFHNANATLFGVAAYVPALMSYINRYGIDLQLGSRLTAVDGDAKVAVFETLRSGGAREVREHRYDMLHVCPPQRAPRFIADSGLADPTGFLDIDPHTLQHRRYPETFGIGDASASANAKTAAAVRKQAPVVAQNLLAALQNGPLVSAYDGYGSCPLTVERGRIVLAEFGYGGRLQPTFPAWLLDGERATRRAWRLKASFLPWLYWNGMLKGREWLVRPGAIEQHR